MSLVKQGLKSNMASLHADENRLATIPIVRGEGACLYDEDGKCYIDAVSSWWVNIMGMHILILHRK